MGFSLSKALSPRGTGGVEASNRAQEQLLALQQQWLANDRNRALQWGDTADSWINTLNYLMQYGSNNPLSQVSNPMSGVPNLQSVDPYSWNTSGIPSVQNNVNLPSVANTDWASMLGEIPTLGTGRTDWGSSLGSYSPDAALQAQINPNIDPEAASKAIESAYLRSGTQSVADQYNALGEQSRLDMARRGLTGSSFAPTSQTALSIARGQGTARNAAEAANQGLQTKTALQQLASQTGLSLADLLRTVQLDANSVLGTQRSWANEDVDRSNANAQQTFLNRGTLASNLQGLNNADTSLRAQLAGQQQGLDESLFNRGMTSWNAGNTAGQNTFQNALDAANFSNQNALTRYGLGQQNYQTGLGQLQSWTDYLQNLSNPSAYTSGLSGLASGYGNLANSYSQIGQNQMASWAPLLGYAGNLLGGSSGGSSNRQVQTPTYSAQSNYQYGLNKPQSFSYNWG